MRCSWVTPASACPDRVSELPHGIRDTSCSSVCGCGFLSCVADCLVAAPPALASDGLWLLEPRVLRSEAACSCSCVRLRPRGLVVAVHTAHSVDGCWHAASAWPGAVAWQPSSSLPCAICGSFVQWLPAALLIAWPWLLDPRVRCCLTALLAACACACAGMGFGCAHLGGDDGCMACCRIGACVVARTFG